MENLFRPQAVKFKRQQSMGRVRLRQPALMRLAASTAIFSLLVFMYFFCYREVSRSVTVDGWTTCDPGLVTLTAPQYGYVTYYNGVVGSNVKKGEILVELSPTRMSRNRNMDQQAEESIRQRRSALLSLSKAQERQLRNSIETSRNSERALVAELRNAEEEIRLQKEKLNLSADVLDRFAYLNSSGHVSTLQISQLRSERSDQLTKIAAMEREKLTLIREIEKTRSDRTYSQDQISINIEQLRDSMEQLNISALEQSAKISVQVVSPVEGEITAKQNSIGQLVSMGTDLITIRPKNSKIIAHLYIPSKAIGDVHSGQQVKIKVAAYPYQKFGYLYGRLISIDVTPVGAEELHRRGGEDTYFRAVVNIDKVGRKGLALRPGMLLSAEVKQPPRTLASSILRPLLDEKHAM